MIQVKNLKKKFGSFEALKGIDLSVQKNDVYGFLGHNGAGKSTTINILTGLSRLDSGSCMIGGSRIEKNVCSQNIGYLPEEPQFYGWMSAKEYLEYLHRGKHNSNRALELLDRVGLKKHAKRKIAGFSRGMKQRLGIAAALVHDPKLLLLDEPSSALDPRGRSEVLDIITGLKDEGKTIFLSTHILSDVERVCNRVGMISAGEMLIEDTLEKLTEDYILPVYDVVFFDEPTKEDINKMKLPGWTETVIVDGKTAGIYAGQNKNKSHDIYSLVSQLKGAVKSVALRQRSLEEVFLKITEEGGTA